jgi:hypothetical protein
MHFPVRGFDTCSRGCIHHPIASWDWVCYTMKRRTGEVHSPCWYDHVGIQPTDKCKFQAHSLLPTCGIQHFHHFRCRVFRMVAQQSGQACSIALRQRVQYVAVFP